MPTLTKKILVESLNEELGLNKREARDVVEHLFEEVKASLANGEPVKLSGMGNFNLLDKGERPGRNPKTGKDALISPRRVVTFRTGPKLRLKISQYSGQEISEGGRKTKK